MRLIASDFITQQRPSPCELRVWLRHRGEPERDASVFEEVLHRLGKRHEREHLASLGEWPDFSRLAEDERIKKTLEAIAARASVLYQPAFLVRHMFGPTEVAPPQSANATTKDAQLSRFSPSQSTRPDAMGSSHPTLEPVDSATPDSAFLS
jgi:hypothetical protein